MIIPPINTLQLSSMHSDTGSRAIVMIMNPQTNMGPHNHLFHEIAHIDGGEGDHVTAQGVQPLHAGDIIIICPGAWHAYENCRGLALTNCLIHPGLLHDLGPLLGHLPGAHELFFRRPRKAELNLPVIVHEDRLLRPRFAALLKTIAAESRGAPTGYQEILLATVLELLVLIIRMQERPRTTRGVSESMRAAVSQAAHIIEEHMTETLTLPTLARQTGVSAAHLCRTFTRQMGMGMVAYQHRLRVEEACRLLRLTQLPVTEIALRLGYSEVAYFSRRFKKEMGLGPAAYRVAK